MEEQPEDMIAGLVVPPVKTLTLKSDDIFKICQNCRVVLRGTISENLLKLVQHTMQDFWHCQGNITLEVCETTLPPEGYEINSTIECLTLTAGDESGFLNALRTCRQLAETSRGTKTVQFYELPCVSIRDFPDLAFRGMHLCWFPETPSWEIEKQLRLAAYYKMNYVVLEDWGVWELTSHPEFCWEEYKVPQNEIKRLVALSKELHVTLIPQLNILGHATASRGGTGKHVLLDMHPEYESLYESDGWTWCISNPETRQYLTEILLEIHQLFDCPPYFHIGCDEADSMGTCRLCRSKDYVQVFIDHLTYFCDLFAARGTRLMMWHDMLLDKKEPRWKGYTVYGRNWNGRTMAEYLPKDIVVCDWQYGYPQGEDGSAPTWPTTAFFKKRGYDVIVCPWLNEQGSKSLAQFAAAHHLMGMLATTWHQNKSGHMRRLFFNAALNSWNPQAQMSAYFRDMDGINRHVREITRDMGNINYAQTGTIQHQINPIPYQGQGF